MMSRLSFQSAQILWNDMLKKQWAIAVWLVALAVFAGLFIFFHDCGEPLFVTMLAVILLASATYFGGILAVPLLLLFFNFLFLPSFAEEEQVNLFLTLINGLTLLISFFGERRRALEKENEQHRQVERETQKEMERLFFLRSKLSQAAKLISLERLSAGLAHELRNPLAIMKTAFRFWRPNSGKEQEAAQIVQEEIGRINDLISEFLPSQNQALQKEEVRLDAILAQAVEKAQKQTHKEIVWQLETVEATLWGNEPSLIRMFLNVLNNAAEAVSESGKIVVKAQFFNANTVFVRILNDGPPIPARLLENLFEPFFSDKEQGTGLGLFIAHSTAQLHGGELRLETNNPVSFLFEFSVDKRVSSEHNGLNEKV